MESSNGIRKEVSKGDIQVTRVYADQYNEGMLTAELKQTITTQSFYPGKSVTSSLQDNIFGASEFGIEEQEYTSSETRVAWLPVPEGSTVESVIAKLKTFPKANLYRILSNRPILTDGQKYAIESPDLEVTLDQIATNQAVRYPNEHEKQGELALDNSGKIQYRSVFFSTQGSEDLDHRTNDPADFYMPEGLSMEVNGIQTVSQQGLND